MQAKTSYGEGLAGFAALVMLLAVLALALLAQAGAGATPRAHPPGGGNSGQARLLAGVRYENLIIFPIVARGADTRGFVTLDEALASGEAIVTESGAEILRRTRDARLQPQVYGGGGQVNRLSLVYRGKRHLLLLAGEVVSGGKQDRVIAKDRIVPPGAEPLPLDVFCVEHGRWAGGAQFASSRFIVHPSVREKAAVDQKQDEVWAAVREGSTSDAARRARNSASGAPAAPVISSSEVTQTVVVEAGSESYGKIYHGRRIGQSVEAFAAEMDRRFRRAVEGLKGEEVVGVAVAYGGEVAWSDWFASGELFQSYWPKLLKSYAVEALARPRTREQASLEDARRFLEPLKGRVNEESEPGVYRWRQVSEGRMAEIELDSLAGTPLTLHRVRILRTS